MNEDRTALKIALGVLGMLAIVAALWRVLAYEPGTVSKPVTQQTVAHYPAAGRAVLPVAQQDTWQELLPEDSFAASANRSIPLSVHPAAALPGRPTEYPNNRASRKEVYPGRSSTAGKRYVDTNFYQADAGYSVPYTQAASSFYNSTSSGPQVNVSSNTFGHVQEERARMLAPYLRPDRKQKEQMDKEWAQLSAAIDRAVLQALTPKSKKEQMLEKYAPKAVQASAAAGLTGPFASVTQAIVTQKNDIVKSFGQAFGSSAARQAGSLMDSFASEIASAASAPGVSAQQAAQQVKEITKKYQKEMEKLEQKSQYDKFVADRVAQDSKQKEELGALYPEQKAQISQLIDQTREKDLLLATQNLSRQEYFNQLAQNNQALRSGIEQLVTQGGQSAQNLRKWEQGQTQQYLEKLNELEETGQIQSALAAATPDDQKRTQADINANRQRLEQDIKNVLGEQALADFEPILENYERALHQLDAEKLSISQRENKKAAIIKETNRQLIDQKIRQIEKMDIPEEQKQLVLEKLRQTYNTFQ